jgi:membrane protein DedA with SNARE-associated domain
LEILYWDEAANDWVAINTQINTTAHYAWATVSHLSTWALAGQTSPAFWEQPWFVPSIVIIVAVVLISIAVVFLKKKKQPPQTKENSGQ